MGKPVIGINTDITGADQKPDYSIRCAYVKAVTEAGGLPLLVPALPEKNLLQEYIPRCDGFLFSGCADYPTRLYGEKPVSEINPMHNDRAETDMLLARLVFETDMPVLGICGGCQLINIALGGKLIQHLETADAHKPVNEHPVLIDEDTSLGKIVAQKRVTVNSTHHQAVDPQALGSGLKISARADDNTVEAIEDDSKRFLIGVQWHPERILKRDHAAVLFEAFIQASASD